MSAPLLGYAVVASRFRSSVVSGTQLASMPITVLRVSLGARSVKKAGRLAGAAGAYAATSLRVSFSIFMLTERYLPLAAVFFVAFMRSHASCIVSSFSNSMDSCGMTIMVPP